ncbi:MAG: PEP-CTERM sorting domain-containing protein [Deltaproteobacteria bacterium]|nr:PEP-CTERM sorting domain-containing protein [Deltaproteobacteria bacterium]
MFARRVRLFVGTAVLGTSLVASNVALADSISYSSAFIQNTTIGYSGSGTTGTFLSTVDASYLIVDNGVPSDAIEIDAIVDTIPFSAAVSAPVAPLVVNATGSAYLPGLALAESNAAAADPSEGSTLSNSTAIANSYVFLSMVLTTPGLLEITANITLLANGDHDDVFESWSTSSFASVTISEDTGTGAGRGGLFVPVTDSISRDFNQSDATGFDSFSDSFVGTLNLSFDTTDLFLANGGEPILVKIGFHASSTANAADERQNVVPEPASLALLGIAIVAGRKRLLRARQ